MNTHPYIALTIALCCSQPTVAGVYKCTGQDGRKIFSSSPCSKNAQYIPNRDLRANRIDLAPDKPKDSEKQGKKASQPELEVNKEAIKSRYKDLRALTRRLIGYENQPLLKRINKRIDANLRRALSAKSVSPEKRAIHRQYNEEAAEAKRRYLTNHASMAEALVTIEAERDEALYDFSSKSRAR